MGQMFVCCGAGWKCPELGAGEEAAGREQESLEGAGKSGNLKGRERERQEHGKEVELGSGAFPQQS